MKVGDLVKLDIGYLNHCMRGVARRASARKATGIVLQTGLMSASGVVPQVTVFWVGIVKEHRGSERLDDSFYRRIHPVTNLVVVSSFTS